MTTEDFDRASGPLTLKRLSELVGGRLEGDPSFLVQAVASIEEAGPEDLAFLSTRKYAKYALESSAGAFLVTEELESRLPEGRPRVVVEEAQKALLVVMNRLYPEERTAGGVHPTAVLGSGIHLGPDVGIGPFVVVGDGARIGGGTRIGAHTVVGANVHMGRDCLLHPHVVLYANTVLGDRVILHSGARVGSDGFGYAVVDGAQKKVPHPGRCVLGDDVEIGVNTAVDRGSVGDTVIGPGAKVDNLVQIGHNAHVGAQTMIAGTAALAGSSHLGKGVYMGGRSGVVNHARVGDGAIVAADALVIRDVPPGQVVSGKPARPHQEALNRQALVSRLPRLMERMEHLESEIAALKETLGP